MQLTLIHMKKADMAATEMTCSRANVRVNGSGVASVRIGQEMEEPGGTYHGRAHQKQERGQERQQGRAKLQPLHQKQRLDWKMAVITA
jgi:hypothetical protein